MKKLGKKSEILNKQEIKRKEIKIEEIKDITKNTDKRKKKKKKIKKKRKLKPEVKIYTIILFISFLFVFISFTFLFKIKNIYIYGCENGCEKYSQQEIIDSGGIKLGKNLLLLDKDKAAQNITKSFAYIEKTEISKKLPSSIEINIKLETPDFFIENDINSKYFLISLNGSVLEISSKEFDNFPKVKGLSLNNINDLNNLEHIDKKFVISYKNEQEKQVLEEIKNSSRDIFKDKIKVIDIENKDNINLNYENKIKIIIGDIKNINYKMQTAKEIISTKLCEEDKGTLDVSLAEVEGKSYFKPNKM